MMLGALIILAFGLLDWHFSLWVWAVTVVFDGPSYVYTIIRRA